MAPNIAVRQDQSEPPVSPEMVKAEVRRTLMEMRRGVEENCDYVGGDFAKEARRIHKGETEERGIYGDATREEAEDLVDEGIPIMPIPWVPTSDA